MGSGRDNFVLVVSVDGRITKHLYFRTESRARNFAKRMIDTNGGAMAFTIYSIEDWKEKFQCT